MMTDSTPPSPLRGLRLVQLRDRIQAEPGIWDGKRALAAYREIGFDCTIQRARANLRMVAERFPGLLTPVEGTRYSYETTGDHADLEERKDTMADMTPEEYEDRKRRLEADAKDAKVALQNAQAYYDKLCWELMNLRLTYQEQQRAKERQ